MKKLLKIIVIIVMTSIASIAVILIVTALHQQEMNAQKYYKIKVLSLPDPSEEESKNWTDTQLKNYYDSIKVSRGITYPRKCPYCYIKHLIED